MEWILTLEGTSSKSESSDPCRDLCKWVPPYAAEDWQFVHALIYKSLWYIR